MSYDPSLEEWKKLYENSKGNKSEFVKSAKVLGVTESAANNAFDSAKKMFGESTSSSSSSSISSSSSSSSPIIPKIAGIQDFSQSLVGDNSGLTTLSGIASETTDILGSFFGEGGSLGKGIGKIFDKLATGAVDLYADVAKQEVDLRAQINSQLGVAGKLSENYRGEIMRSLAGVTSMKYGFKDLTDLTIGLAEQTGKFTTLNEQTIRETAITARAFVGNLSDMASAYVSFGNVGVGVEATNKAINEAGTSSLGLGLNAKKTVDVLRNDIGKLNEYGFQNGIQGLTRMIQKSTEFKINMNDIYNIAEKVMSPDSAIDLAANLSVLGGAIGDFGDPLKMMYDATNNVEGLQDALVGAAGSLATYNSEQGRFEITGVNLRRAREMASALGMSLSDLTKTSIAAAERSSAAADLMANGLKLDDNQTEFITNLARMKDGKMVIDVSSISKEFGGAQQIALDQLTETQVKILEKNQNALKELSPEEIARDQFTATQNLLLQVSDIATMLKVRFKQSGLVKGAESLTDDQIRQVGKYLQEAKAEKPGNTVGSILKFSRTGEVSDSFDGGKVKKQEALKVDNKPKKQGEIKKEESSIKQQFKEALAEHEMSVKNNRNQSINITNEVVSDTPRDYTYKIGGR